MIITKEGEEFQNLLKKVECLENFIRRSNYYAGCDPVEEKKPEFKIGDWVVRTVGKKATGRELGRIFRVVKNDDNDDTYGALIYGQVYADDGTTHFRSSLRLATQDEIKNHLVIQAIKKGFQVGCKFKWDGEAGTCHMESPGYTYYAWLDALVVRGVNGENSVYYDGKWATLVKEKKELPKTMAAFESLLKDFASNYYAQGCFSDRDNDVDEYLRINNYK